MNDVVQHVLDIRNRFSILPPKIVACIDVLIGTICALVFRHADTWMLFGIWMGVRSCSWLILIYCTSYPPSVSKFCHWFSLALFQIGFIIYVLIVDQSSSFGAVSILWYGVLACGSILPAISFWLIPRTRSELVFLARPHVRVGVAMMLFGLSGLWAGYNAAITLTLYPASSWLILLLSVSSISMLTAGVAWWWYMREALRSLVNASAVLLWCMIQVGFVVSFWPIGFLFAGVIMSWVWYIIWLTLRYYMSEDGIAWPRHGYFLFAHGIALLVVLCGIVRWK